MDITAMMRPPYGAEDPEDAGHADQALEPWTILLRSTLRNSRRGCLRSRPRVCSISAVGRATLLHRHKHAAFASQASTPILNVSRRHERVDWMRARRMRSRSRSQMARSTGASACGRRIISADLRAALREAVRVATKGVLIYDPWYDERVPSQAMAAKLDRWYKRTVLRTVTSTMGHFGRRFHCCAAVRADVRRRHDVPAVAAIRRSRGSLKPRPREDLAHYDPHTDQHIVRRGTRVHSARRARTGLSEAGALVVSTARPLPEQALSAASPIYSSAVAGLRVARGRLLHHLRQLDRPQQECRQLLRIGDFPLRRSAVSVALARAGLRGVLAARPSVRC